MKFTDKKGRVFSGEVIETESDIKHIRNRGYFGKTPEIGDVSEYLGSLDGGYVIHDKKDLTQTPPYMDMER